MEEDTAVDHITMEAMVGHMIMVAITAAIGTAVMATMTEDIINQIL
jgi:hypothetical protein